MLRVDCQVHVFPKEYAQLLLRSPGPLRVQQRSGGYWIDYGGRQQFLLNLEQYTPQARREIMDAAEIDVSVLSVNIPGPEWLPEDLAVEAARLCNDYLAEVCARYPGRFVGLASLPLQDVPAAMAELERAIGRLGLRGVVLPSNIAGQPVDAPQLEPLYDRIEALAVPLVLHPTVPGWASAVQDYSMIPMIGFMVDTSIAMLRLILSGLLERHPRLTVVHPHAGGVLPYIIGRVDEQTEVKRRGREHIRQAPSAYYKRVYLDLATPSTPAMQYACDFAGADRLLFASDAPWVSLATMLECVKQLAVPEADRAKILGLNAARLFKITGG